jgi:peptidoglycan/LPS O-acetylase OafA/YrhL
MSKKQPRLLGVDLCRGLAAYAVVLVHSGDETWKLPISESAIQFRLIFYFAVPFFLAAAFYFLTRRSPINISLSFWKSRAQRIIIPYTIWSLIYVALRSIFFLRTHQTDRLADYLHDPLSLVLMGGASYHLYFLPLLLTGTVLLPVAKYLVERNVKMGSLVALATLGIVYNEIVHATGNEFQLGEDIAFAHFLAAIPKGIWHEIARLILVQTAWIAKCAPYMLVALILHRLLTKLDFSKGMSARLAIVCFILFSLVTTVGKVILPHSLQEVLVAYLLLLTGIFGSSSLRETKLAASVGACSFGIYLIHPILMNLVKPLIARGFPGLSQTVSIASMLTFSISSFLLSWLIVSILGRQKRFAKYLFGA